MTPDLVVFDTLDTTEAEVAAVKATGAKVVCLEDLGPGGTIADLCLNELYEPQRNPFAHDWAGPRWAVLRPEFCGLPRFRVREKASRILLTFGGHDPAGLTDRISPLLHGYHVSTVVGGQVVSMAELIRAVDLVVCSAGRTVHEAAACGVPVVSIAVNERESRHVHCPGILRLGLAHTLSDSEIRSTVVRVMGDYDLRREMSETSSAAVDGKGAQRIVAKIDALLCGL